MLRALYISHTARGRSAPSSRACSAEDRGSSRVASARPAGLGRSLKGSVSSCRLVVTLKESGAAVGIDARELHVHLGDHVRGVEDQVVEPVVVVGR